jgi:hypothetical protein
MEIELYHKGKRFIAQNIRELDEKLTTLFHSEPSEQDLTNIRFEIIVKMLEIDENLRKRVKGFVLTYC